MRVPLPEGRDQIGEGFGLGRRGCDGARDGRERGGGEVEEAGEEEEEEGEGEHDCDGEGVYGFGRHWHGGEEENGGVLSLSWSQRGHGMGMD